MRNARNGAGALPRRCVCPHDQRLLDTPPATAHATRVSAPRDSFRAKRARRKPADESLVRQAAGGTRLLPGRTGARFLSRIRPSYGRWTVWPSWRAAMACASRSRARTEGARPPPVAQPAPRIAALERELDELHRVEEALVAIAITAGQPVHRSPAAPPGAVLGVRVAERVSRGALINNTAAHSPGLSLAFRPGPALCR
jgi:hypothetical protein